jgi:hypothetical protein
VAEGSKPRHRATARKPARTAPEPASGETPATAPARSDDPPAPGPIDAASLDEAFVKALEADFLESGAAAIAAMRAEKPVDYVKIVAALWAKRPNDTTDPLREMSDAELDRSIEELAHRAGYEIREIAVRRVVGREDPAADDGADAD